VARDLAIGAPADGFYALHVARTTGGEIEACTEDEIVDGIRLLAETEGLFGETAGGTVVAAARRMAAGGAFADGRPVVLLITGHGLKTVEALGNSKSFDVVIDGKLAEFETFWAEREAAA